MKRLYGFSERLAINLYRVRFLIFLIIVIGVVIFFVGDSLRSLLENRQNLILVNLNEAEKKAQKAKEKLFEAKSQFEMAELKAKEIAEHGIITLDKDKNDSQRQTEEMIQRLDKLKEETLFSQQQIALKSLSKRVIQSSLLKVQDEIQKNINDKFQISVNNFYIALFRKYGSKKKKK